MTSYLSLKKWMGTVALLASLGSTFATQLDPTEAVIPKPVESKATEGVFAFDQFSYISAPAELKETAEMFAKSVKLHTGLILTVSDAIREYKKISFEITDVGTKSKEGYTISVSEDAIVIKAPSKAGLFYAGQTLIQMTKNAGFGQWEIPCSEVKDEPRFAWRGLMLDEGRHFHGKTYVKHLLDNMALHKMNIFHWHLTDDEGWRIEIKAYPKLTEVAAWRGKGTEMPQAKWDARSNAPQKNRYGGYYTQEDIKEIVAYAAERHINILPEIDVPGHVTALVTAYPEFLPTLDKTIKRDPKKKKSNQSRPLEELAEIPTAYRSNVLSVVPDSKTYDFVDTVFKEVTALFPYKYIHIGGDEVHVTYWEYSPEHLAFMKEQGFTEARQLQNYFMLRLEKILKKYGRTLMGWNEIMKGGELSRDSGVMAWISIGAGLKAAQAGYPTVMAVAPHNYFDMAYPGKGEIKGNWWAGTIDSKKAYEWNPLFTDKLTPAEQAKIKGVHACVWSEFVETPSNADYKFWPRAASTAEVAWTPQADRSWSEYKVRFGKHARFLDNMKVTYRVAPPIVTLAKGKVTIEAFIPGYTTIYTTDGTTPVPGKAKVYKGEVLSGIDFSKIRVMAIRPSGLKSIVIEGASRTALSKFRVKGPKTVTIKADLSTTLDKAGQWAAFLSFEENKNSTLNVTKLVVKKDGKAVLETTPNLKTAAKGAKVPFELKSFDKSASYTLELTVKLEDEKGRTFGELSVDR